MKENMRLKQEAVAEIKGKLEKAKSIALVDYRSINVAQDTKLRKRLREAGVEYKVYKNRLVQRVMDDLGYSDINNELQDTTAIAISYDDVVAPSKIITECAKEFNKLTIKAGIVEGKIYDKAQMDALSKIPAKEVLIAQLLGMLTAPLRNLAIDISEIAKQKEAN